MVWRSATSTGALCQAALDVLLKVLRAPTFAANRYERLPLDVRASRRRKQFLLSGITSWSTCGADSHELLVLVEIALQVYQAYKLSHLVATPWVNRLMVLVIVVNCWFMSIVSVVFRKKTPSFIKVVHLAIDAVLEIVYGMFIPLAIFYPYYRDAYHIMFDTPFINFYMDTWYVGTVAENRQIFVTSWLDFCSKMVPGISLFLRLLALQNQRTEHESRVRIATLAKITLDDADFRSTTLHKKTIVSAIMFLFGLGVLVVHLTANAISFTGRDPGCLLEMMPFGSTQYMCAVLEVSCTQKKITGTKSELDEALSKVDPNTLQGLIFSHCEALSIPPRLKTFPKLVEIKIHNCSIAEWGEDAALTGEEHPVLQNLYVTMTNMSSIPDGLLSPKFPLLLVDVEFCGTNLTELPIDLFEKWPMVLAFYLELSPGITEFPPALYRQPSNSVLVLSLSSNSITVLPDGVFAEHQCEVVMLSGNPLTKLPDELGTAPAMVALAIAFTDIAEALVA